MGRSGDRGGYFAKVNHGKSHSLADVQAES